MSSHWKAYADLDYLGRDVRLNIYADHGDHQHYDAVSSIGLTGTTVTTSLIRTDNATEPGGLRIPLPVAEAMYLGLDRIFGKHHDQPTLLQMLQKEQERVDKVMDRLFEERSR